MAPRKMLGVRARVGLFKDIAYQYFKQIGSDLNRHAWSHEG